jgi:WD40 repeat protein
MKLFRMQVAAILVASGLSGCRGPAEVGPGAEAKGGKPCPAILDFPIGSDSGNPIRQIAMAPDGQLALSWRPFELSLWDLTQRQLLRTVNAEQAFAITPDSRHAAWIARDANGLTSQLSLWDLRSGHKVRDLEVPPGSPRSMAFAPDGKHLVACSAGAPPTLWDLASGKIVRTFEGGSYRAHAVEFSPDGHYVVAQGGRLWEAATGKVLREFTREGAVLDHVAFSATGRHALATARSRGGNDWELGMWEVATGREVLARPIKGNLPTFAVLPGGKQLLTSGTDREGVRLVDLPTGRVLRTSDEAPGLIYRIAVAADGKKALLLLQNSLLMLWDRDRDEVDLLARPKLVGQGVGVAFLPDGKQAVECAEEVTLWDVTTGQQVRRFRGFPVLSCAPAVSADGKLVLAGGRGGKLWLWESATGKVVWRKKALEGYVRSVAFSPDGTQALVGGDDGVDPPRRPVNGYKAALSLWGVKSGQLVQALSGHQDLVFSVAFSADGKQALSGSDDGTVKLWDLANGNALWTVAGPAHDEWHSAFAPGRLAFSADGRLALWQGRRPRTWNRASGRMVSVQDRPDAAARAFAISPDGRLGLSGEDKGVLCLWDMANGQLVRVFQAGQGDYQSVGSVAFSPDGRLALSSGSQGTVLWEVATGQRLRSWVDETRCEPEIRVRD